MITRGIFMDNTEQIREELEKALKEPYNGIVHNKHKNRYISNAIALLPCGTCGGSGIKPFTKFYSCIHCKKDVSEDHLITDSRDKPKDRCPVCRNVVVEKSTCHLCQEKPWLPPVQVCPNCDKRPKECTCPPPVNKPDNKKEKPDLVPEAGKKVEPKKMNFTEKVLFNLDNWEESISKDDVRVKTLIEWLRGACEIIDRNIHNAAGTLEQIGEKAGENPVYELCVLAIGIKNKADELEADLKSYRAAFGNQGLLQQLEARDKELETENKALRDTLDNVLADRKMLSNTLAKTNDRIKQLEARLKQQAKYIEDGILGSGVDAYLFATDRDITWKEAARLLAKDVLKE